MYVSIKKTQRQDFRPQVVRLEPGAFYTLKMSAEKRYPTIPENADKILFAEDIVNYSLSRLDLPLLSSGIADHRASILNAFGPEVRLAANICFDDSNEDTTDAFGRFLKKKTIVIKDFIKYANHQKLRLGAFFADEVRDFLSSCIKLSIMAGKFYQHGILDAPNLAFERILILLEGIDMIEEGGWNALNTISTDWAKVYIDIKTSLTPPSDHGRGGYDCSEIDSKNDFGHHPIDESDVSTEEEYRSLFIDSCGSSPEGPVTPNKQIEKTDEGKSGNSQNFSDDMIESVPAGSSGERDPMVYYSSVVTSKEDGISLKIIRKEQHQRPSFSYSKESGSSAKQFKVDVQAADDIQPFGRQLTEERSSISGSRANKRYHSDSSAQNLKTSNSDNHTAENVHTSSVEDRVQTSDSESGRRKKAVPKKRTAFPPNR